MKPSKVYEEVRKQAYPIMEAYINDLTVIDMKLIYENQGTPFLHFTGKTGTNLEMLHPPEWYPSEGKLVPYIFGRADRHHILNGVVSSTKCMKQVSRQELILYYDGKTVKKITQAKAEELAEDYKRSILAAWRREGRLAA